MRQTMNVLSVVTLALFAMTAQAQVAGQASAGAASDPCGPPATGVVKTANTLSTDSKAIGTASDSMGNTAASINAAKTKFKSLFGKKTTSATGAAPQPAAPTSPATLQAAELAALQNQKAAGKAPAAPGTKPCAPGTARPANQAASVPSNALVAAQATPGASALQSLTPLPDGGYMLVYSAAGSEQKTYVPVKKISGATTPAHPNDGYYTDDKNFYTVTGASLAVTPIKP